MPHGFRSVIDLRHRATEPELLDEGVDPAETQRSLGDLRWANRWLGGRRALRRAVEPLLDGRSSVRLLDVGCGSADLAADLVARSRGRLRAVGLDVKQGHLASCPGSVEPVVADARRLPFPDRAFDLVCASLFAHHFDADELPSLLSELFRVARRALVLNDLRRGVTPYLFGRLVFPVLFDSPVSVHDGVVSIRRAFTDAELLGSFAAAGIAQVRVTRRFPYRLVAVAEKDPPR